MNRSIVKIMSLYSCTAKIKEKTYLFLLIFTEEKSHGMDFHKPGNKHWNLIVINSFNSFILRWHYGHCCLSIKLLDHGT